MVTKAVVLKNTKYRDSSLISTMYTQLYGVQTYIINGVRKTNKHGGTKANLLQTGQILELETNHQAQKNLQYLKSFNAAHICSSIANSVSKNAIVVFCCELYYSVLKNPETNNELYDLLSQSVMHIEHTAEKDLANFPIYFALRFAFLMGYSIHGEYDTESRYLDLKEGNYTNIKTQYTVLDFNTANIFEIINTPIESLNTIKLNKDQRFAILNDCILFLKLHLPEMREINSLKVLHEVI